MILRYSILVDTGFWIALFDPRDQFHDYAVEREDWLEDGTLIMPFEYGGYALPIIDRRY